MDVLGLVVGLGYYLATLVAIGGLLRLSVVLALMSARHWAEGAQNTSATPH